MADAFIQSDLLESSVHYHMGSTSLVIFFSASNFSLFFFEINSDTIKSKHLFIVSSLMHSKQWPWQQHISIAICMCTDNKKNNKTIFHHHLASQSWRLHPARSHYLLTALALPLPLALWNHTESTDQSNTSVTVSIWPVGVAIILIYLRTIHVVILRAKRNSKSDYYANVGEYIWPTKYFKYWGHVYGGHSKVLPATSSAYLSSTFSIMITGPERELSFERMSQR